MTVGPLLRASLDACAADRDLLAGPHARTIVGEVRSLAKRLSIAALHPASAAGDRLIGGLLLASAGELRLWDQGTREAVLVVEGVAASDVAVRIAERHALERGAARVHGVSIVQVTDSGRAQLRVALADESFSLEGSAA